MSKCFAVLTTLGEAMVAESIRSGADINLCEMAVGDADYTPDKGQTNLMHERARVAIGDILFDQNNPAWLRIMAVLPPELGGFYMREAGLFCKNGNLFAVAKLDGSYKPVYSDGLVKEIALDIVLEISSDANVNLVIDPNVIGATRQWVMDYFGARMAGLETLFKKHTNDRNNPHGVTAEQLGVYTKNETEAQIKHLNVFAYPGAFHNFYLLSPPPGWKARNGAVLANADVDFPELWKTLTNPENAWLLRTEAAWKSLSNLAGGIGGAPFFVVDGAAKSIRLPDTRGDYERCAGGGTMAGVGQWHDSANKSHNHSYVDSGYQGLSGGGYNPYLGFAATKNLNTGHEGAAEARTRAFGVLGCVYTGGK